MNKTLYKLSSKGVEQIWNIEVKNNPPRIIIQHGQLGGKLQTKTDIIKAGKNIGKINETTPLQQAYAEAESRFNKQKDRKGYSETRGQARTLSPMLAHKYKDHKDKIVFPCFTQPKLDGIRCIATYNYDTIKLISRQNKEFEVLDHIKDALSSIMTPGMILDGELFNRDYPVTSISGFCKKLQPETKFIQYHVYDVINKDNFKNRTQLLHKLQYNDIIQCVETMIVDNHHDIDMTFQRYLKDGYEGCMIRAANGLYKVGYRSTDLLKLKEFQDADFTIIDIVENTKLPGTGVFHLITDEGYEFKAMPEGSMEKRASYLQNKQDYLGKIGMVRFFDWTKTDKPVPFHPVFVRAKGDKE